MRRPWWYVFIHVCKYVHMCINILMYLYIGHDDPEVNVPHTAQKSTRKSSVEGFTYEYSNLGYGVTTISRLLKIIGLFCKRAL